MINRQEEIRKKGFNMRLDANDSIQTYTPMDFSKVKIGTKTLTDAVLTLGQYRRINPSLGDKKAVLRAITSGDVEKMRQISTFFFRISGIYSRLCRYVAKLYRYDWFITPYIESCQGLIESNADINETETDSEAKVKQKNEAKVKQKKKIFGNFFKVLKYFEQFEIKKFFGQVALKVIKYGCYYCYQVPGTSRINIQELDPKYCRSRFKKDMHPAVQFNMRYFDQMFISQEQKSRMLNLFPEEFKKGYKLYRQGKLPPTFVGDESGWYLLDPKYAMKFSVDEQDFPPFIAVIPAIIDLDAAQDLDRKKMAQKLLKVIIQKLPLDKNGDLVFDVDEAKELHNNAVKMLSRAIGVDILTTFAEVNVADMSDKGTTTTTDELEKVERTVFNEAGVSQLQFNSDGNIALNNSILNDESFMYSLLVQFESFLNLLLEPFNRSPKKVYYKAQFLTTTVYNYKQIAKLYKEQAQMGYSKMLPQVALGQTQSSILANTYFENDILDLVRVFIPPLTSNTMNAEALQNRKTTSGKSDNGIGRPEKEDNQKSEKTIQNKESM